MKCDIEDAPLEQPYPEGTILRPCYECATDLTGNSIESILNEEAALLSAEE